MNTIVLGERIRRRTWPTLPVLPPQVMNFMQGLHALKRMARPEEIAQPVLCLASESSSFVTGAALLVDEGLSISRT